MGQTDVYGEVVLFVNLVMNYLILWLTARFNHTFTSRKRLFAGASFGALYALAMFLPDFNYMYSMFGKLFLSVVIILITFAPVAPKRFLAILGYFYLISFSMLGIVIGISYFINNYSGANYAYHGVLNVLNKYFWYAILLGLGVGAAVGVLGPALMKRKIIRNIFKVPLSINFGGNCIQLDALIDTGNNLRDPISRMPVIVVEYSALEQLLPLEMKQVFTRGGEAKINDFLDSLQDVEWTRRLRLIPYKSLGRQDGMLIAFRPDEVVINTGPECIKTKRIIIGVHHQQLCPEGSYRALLHPDILHAAIS